MQHGKAFQPGISQKTCLVWHEYQPPGKGVAIYKYLSVLVFTHSWRHAAVIVFIVFCSVFAGHVKAQDTVRLNEIAVSVTKISFGAPGKKLESLDSATLSRLQNQTLAQVLSTESSMHIKSYGPGAIATSAFRGGSAAQTALVWNGINIQNRMLGQTDLSLLPAFLFDRVSIQYGSSSALWGNGAIGGSVLLDTRTPFANGKSLLLTAGGGSFGNGVAGARYSYSAQNLVSTSKGWWRQARNDFQYRLGDEPTILRAQHAAYNQMGWQQELRYKLSPRRSLSLNAWMSAADRQMPSFQGERISQAFQTDRNLRLLAEFEQIGGFVTSHFKTAFLREVLNYTDSAASVFSRSKVNTFLAEHDSYLRWKKQLWHVGLNASTSQAQASAYGQHRDLSCLSASAGNTFFFMKSKLILQIQLRQDLYSQGAKPFTFNLGGTKKIGTNFTLQVNLAKVYRHPSLNELYWQPGGNPQLKPERGYSSEGQVVYERHQGQFKLHLSGAGFSRLIFNWILWVPGAYGNPSPVNLLSVWSRGTETTSKCTWTLGKNAAGVSVRTAYVLSTIQNSGLPEDASLHKQLIYTPRYTGSGNLFFQIHRFRIDYTQLYVGYRFITSDHSDWLKPYTTADIRASYGFGPSGQYALSIHCFNLFNQSYSVIQGRPASLRYFECSFIWQPKI